MHKKRIIFGISCMVLVLISIDLLVIFKNRQNEEILLSNKAENKNIINNGFLTLMLEQSDGSYQKSTSNTWPTSNYAFNSTLSGCERGGELEWDREANIVKLLSNRSDKCYVYFDLYNVVKITNVTSSKSTNSVTLTVTIEAGENAVDKYYFSSDGGNSYQESSSPNYTFSNLTPNTTYTFQVYAEDIEGYESNEEVVEVTTDNYVNPTVNSVSVTNTSTDSISVSVSASGGTNNVATYYYSINNGAYTSSSSNTHTFNGLNRGTTYIIKVYVKDSIGVDSGVYTINTETENIVLLADYIKGLYTSQGSNRIYYHTSSLANSAEDNSYRYTGAKPNNYVCFGSDGGTCSSDNLYRIIGVFGNEVKLIKSISYEVAVWNVTNNTWSSRTKPSVYYILNDDFLETLNSTWQNKIAMHTWKVGGLTDSNGRSTPKTAYNYEIGNNSSSTTDSMKIGLMYLSDYYYAATPTYWTYPGYSAYGSNYDYRAATSSNWLYSGLNEWTISRRSDHSEYAFDIDYSGRTSIYIVDGSMDIRPCFYLTSSITYVSGSGTSSNPFRIN